MSTISLTKEADILRPAQKRNQDKSGAHNVYTLFIGSNEAKLLNISFYNFNSYNLKWLVSCGHCHCGGNFPRHAILFLNIYRSM